MCGQIGPCGQSEIQRTFASEKPLTDISTLYGGEFQQTARRGRGDLPVELVVWHSPIFGLPVSAGACFSRHE
jgi:hypothetical protein